MRTTIRFFATAALAIALLVNLSYNVEAQHRTSWTELSSLETTLDVVFASLGPTSDIYLRQGQHTELRSIANWRGRQIEVSFDSGPWQKVSGPFRRWEPIHIDIPWTKWKTPGVYSIQMRFLLGSDGGWTVRPPHKVTVVPAATRLFEDANGNYMLHWKGETGPLDTPIMIVEGIDPKPSYYSTYEKDLRPILDGFDGFNVDADENHPERYYAGATSFMSRAHALGADILILNFADAGASLETNKGYVQEAVRYISQIKDGNTPIRLSGISMGGVLARYALAEAEVKGDPLDVSHFASLDSPQRGAVMDPNFLNYLKKEGLALPGVASDAAADMLLNNPFRFGRHENVYRRIRSINTNYGYPENVKNIGVAFSTNSPKETLINSPSPGPYITEVIIH